MGYQWWMESQNIHWEVKIWRRKNCCGDVRFSLTEKCGVWTWPLHVQGGWDDEGDSRHLWSRQGKDHCFRYTQTRKQFCLLNKALMEIFSLSRSTTAVSNCVGAELQDDFRPAVKHWWGTICKTQVNYNDIVNFLQLTRENVPQSTWSNAQCDTVNNQHADVFYC